MKPKEFDELVRQKFDQNDFAYSPRNWEHLAEQMDGRAKKRSMLMWWLMPLAGIAASVALAMGVTGLLRQPQSGLPGTNSALVQASGVEKQHTIQNEPATALVATNMQFSNTVNNSHPHIQQKKQAEKIKEDFAISFENAVGFTPAAHKAKEAGLFDELVPRKHKAEVAVAEGYNTFIPEEETKKAPKVSIILSAGISHGSQNSGYAAGATIRRMLNDKVFIESDVAFAKSSNSQTTEVFVPDGGGARHAAAKSTSIENTTTVAITQAPKGTIQNENQTYDLYYAQVSPSIGYKVIKRMSVGIGPDFQQMLADNRPATSTVDRNNIAVAPMFDVGFIGKTEFALTKKVKAGVSYRKGINNILTPMDKYIDRDYLQFQLKCTIFNK